VGEIALNVDFGRTADARSSLRGSQAIVANHFLSTASLVLPYLESVARYMQSGEKGSVEGRPGQLLLTLMRRRSHGAALYQRGGDNDALYGSHIAFQASDQ